MGDCQIIAGRLRVVAALTCKSCTSRSWRSKDPCGAPGRREEDPGACARRPRRREGTSPGRQPAGTSRCVCCIPFYSDHFATRCASIDLGFVGQPHILRLQHDCCRNRGRGRQTRHHAAMLTPASVLTITQSTATGPQYIRKLSGARLTLVRIGCMFHEKEYATSSRGAKSPPSPPPYSFRAAASAERREIRGLLPPTRRAEASSSSLKTLSRYDHIPSVSITYTWSIFSLLPQFPPPTSSAGPQIDRLNAYCYCFLCTVSRD
jgi:hypothetical protein